MIAIAKAEITKIIERQPDDSSYDEIMRELIFSQMIGRGLEDSVKGKTISHKNMKKEMESWLK